MAVTVIATAKGTTSNSYATLTDAESYMEGRSDTTTWDAASNDTKNRALVTATNRLEQQDFHGTPTDADQRLKWPRSGLTDMDSRSYDQDEIPRPVEEAAYEMALPLVNGDLELKDTGLEGFNSVGVGPLKIDVFHGREAGALPRQIRRLLRGLMVGSSGLTVPVARS